MDEVSQPMPQAPTPEQKNHYNWLRTLAIGFGIVSIGITIALGGYLLATKTSQPQTQKVVIQPTPTPDPTANWKTYKDDRYGYEIKYPSNWYLAPTAKEGYGATTIITNYDSQKSSEKTGFTENMIKIQISLINKPNEQPFKSWAAATIQETINSSVNKDYGMTLDSQKSISVNDVEGIQYSFKYNTSPSTLSIYFPKNSSDVFAVYVIPSDSKDIEIFNQILSTFQFSP